MTKKKYSKIFSGCWNATPKHNLKRKLLNNFNNIRRIARKFLETRMWGLVSRLLRVRYLWCPCLRWSGVACPGIARKFLETGMWSLALRLLKPAIHLSSNWREREKMLAKREKREVYRWHFVNHLANHFSYLAFRCSRQAIGIFTKRQRAWYGKFLVKFLAESKMNKISDIVRNV